MKDRRRSGLRQAAATVFVLTAVLPLLIFTWILHRLNAIHDGEAQIGLILALIVALLGFAVFRSMMTRLSEVMSGLSTAAAKRAAARGPSVAVSSASPSSSAGRSSAALRREATVPGLGAIRELRDIADSMSTVWQREATPYLGRRVLVSVLNAGDPLSGTLVKVTENGVLLEKGDEQIVVGYRRFAGIELDS